MSIISKLSRYDSGNGIIYGIYPYGSFFAARTKGMFDGIRKYIDAVIYFKKQARNADKIRTIIDAVCAELECEAVVAVPSSTAGNINVIQRMYGEGLRRTKSSQPRKYNHKAELNEEGKIVVECECKGKKLLLVDDIATTGKTMLYFKSMLEKLGAKVEMLVVGINYKLAPADQSRIEQLENEMKEARKQSEKEANTVGTSELSEWLGVVPSYITILKRYGCVVEAVGGYDLKATVAAYIAYLKSNNKNSDKSTLETEALALKNEKAKTYLENWRRDRDRQIAGAIVEALRGALLAFKENVQRGMAVNQAIDAVLDGLEAVDLEIVLEPLEQDEEEDEN